MLFYLNWVWSTKKEVTSNQNNQIDDFLENRNDEYGNDSLNTVISSFVDKIDEDWMNLIYNLSSYDSIHNSGKKPESKQIDFNNFNRYTQVKTCLS